VDRGTRGVAQGLKDARVSVVVPSRIVSAFVTEFGL
jgi:hypothetical protein